MKRTLPAAAALLLWCAGCSIPTARNLEPLSPSLDGHLEELADAGAHNPDSSTAPPDLGRSSSTVDFGPITGCNGLINCLNLCNPSDGNCFNNCFNQTTPQGQSLFAAIETCMDQACPRVAATDPCNDPSSAACGNCLTNAQSTTCAGTLTACQNDLP